MDSIYVLRAIKPKYVINSKQVLKSSVTLLGYIKKRAKVNKHIPSSIKGGTWFRGSKIARYCAFFQILNHSNRFKYFLAVLFAIETY